MLGFVKQVSHKIFIGGGYRSFSGGGAFTSIGKKNYAHHHHKMSLDRLQFGQVEFPVQKPRLNLVEVF